MTDPYAWTDRRPTLERLAANDSLSPQAARFVAGCAAANLGVLVSGPAGSGKTTFADAWLGSLNPALRVVMCEETRELSPPLNGKSMKTPGPRPDGRRRGDLAGVVKYGLGLQPDLLVVGEVMGGEAYELSKVANRGAPALATIQVDSSADAFPALVTAAALRFLDVPTRLVRTQFSRIFQLLVHLDRHAQPVTGTDERVRHQVVEIAAVRPQHNVEADVTVQPVFVRDGLGAPMVWTGVLPDDLRVRLDQALQPTGVTGQDLLASDRGMWP